MAEFVRANFGLKRLVDNSYKAIDHGVYETNHLFIHDTISLRKAITLCAHAPLVTEIKFSSPSQGKIRSKTEPAKIAKTMVDSGAIGISVLTQPFLFDGSIEYLAAIRKALPGVPILMKDITVSTVQIEAGKKVGADCVLLIKSIFDNNLAEDSIEKLLEYARNRGLEVLVEVHTEQELGEVLKAKQDLVGINNRDLRTFKVSLDTSVNLIARAKEHPYGSTKIFVAESGIHTSADVHKLSSAGAHAILVGESLMRESDIVAKTRELLAA